MEQKSIVDLIFKLSSCSSRCTRYTSLILAGISRYCSFKGCGVLKPSYSWAQQAYC